MVSVHARSALDHGFTGCGDDGSPQLWEFQAFPDRRPEIDQQPPRAQPQLHRSSSASLDPPAVAQLRASAARRAYSTGGAVSFEGDDAGENGGVPDVKADPGVRATN